MSTNAERARRWFSEVSVPVGEPTVHELMADAAIGVMEGGVGGMTWFEFQDGCSVRGWNTWNPGGARQLLMTPAAG